MKDKELRESVEGLRLRIGAVDTQSGNLCKKVKDECPSDISTKYCPKCRVQRVHISREKYDDCFGGYAYSWATTTHYICQKCDTEWRYLEQRVQEIIKPKVKKVAKPTK